MRGPVLLLSAAIQAKTVISDSMKNRAMVRLRRLGLLSVAACASLVFSIIFCLSYKADMDRESVSAISLRIPVGLRVCERMKLEFGW